MTDLAGIVYFAATVAVIGFQLALAAGAPWGEVAMGGRYPGRFPPALRVTAAVQAVILAMLAEVVLDAAGAVPLGWTEALPWLPWLPVVFAALSVFVNAISPSTRER